MVTVVCPGLLGCNIVTSFHMMVRRARAARAARGHARHERGLMLNKMVFGLHLLVQDGDIVNCVLG